MHNVGTIMYKCATFMLQTTIFIVDVATLKLKCTGLIVDVGRMKLRSIEFVVQFVTGNDGLKINYVYRRVKIPNDCAAKLRKRVVQTKK